MQRDIVDGSRLRDTTTAIRHFDCRDFIAPAFSLNPVSPARHSTQPQLATSTFLSSAAERSVCGPSNPLHCLDSLSKQTSRPSPPAIAPQPSDFNIPTIRSGGCPKSIRSPSTIFLPDMRSSIKTGSGQALNTAATQGFPISSAEALRKSVIVSQSAGFHICSVHGIVGRVRG